MQDAYGVQKACCNGKPQMPPNMLGIAALGVKTHISRPGQRAGLAKTTKPMGEMLVVSPGMTGSHVPCPMQMELTAPSGS